jgi:hypothetical protein
VSLQDLNLSPLSRPTAPFTELLMTGRLYTDRVLYEALQPQTKGHSSPFHRNDGGVFS